MVNKMMINSRAELARSGAMWCTSNNTPISANVPALGTLVPPMPPCDPTPGPLMNFAAASMPSEPVLNSVRKFRSLRLEPVRSNVNA